MYQGSENQSPSSAYQGFGYRFGYRELPGNPFYCPLLPVNELIGKKIGPFELGLAAPSTKILPSISSQPLFKLKKLFFFPKK
jgi:hypothetical protein